MIKDKKLQSGSVYYSKRSDIDPPKKKYQLYFDDDTVLLINTLKSKYSVSVRLEQKDCPILDYDSFICIDSVFRFEKDKPILKACSLPVSILKRVKDMVYMSNTLSGYQIEKIDRRISLILAEKELKK